MRFYQRFIVHDALVYIFIKIDANFATFASTIKNQFKIRLIYYN